MALEEDGDFDRPIAAAVRAAKKSARPTKITEPMARPITGKQVAKAKAKRKGKKGASAFDDDKGKKGAVGTGSHEGMRAKKTKVSLDKKGGKGPKKR
jgi:ATP-dependent RNA helicase DDX27